MNVQSILSFLNFFQKALPAYESGELIFLLLCYCCSQPSNHDICFLPAYWRKLQHDSHICHLIILQVLES